VRGEGSFYRGRGGLPVPQEGGESRRGGKGKSLNKGGSSQMSKPCKKTLLGVFPKTSKSGKGKAF